jgi:hypothetical protein
MQPTPDWLGLGWAPNRHGGRSIDPEIGAKTFGLHVVKTVSHHAPAAGKHGGENFGQNKPPRILMRQTLKDRN